LEIGSLGLDVLALATHEHWRILDIARLLKHG
jgi:hypothetical protein